MSFCTRPFWERLAEATTDPSALWDWAFCPYAVDIGLAPVGAIMIMTGFIGLKNWSESWVLPLVWLALVAPIVAAYALTGGLIRVIAGVLTFGVVMLFIGLYYWWGRA